MSSTSSMSSYSSPDFNSESPSPSPVVAKKVKKIPASLSPRYEEWDTNVMEVGMDEVGRGPLFGRVYAAAVILPKDDTFEFSKMKDSKKFHSPKKIQEVSQYIQEHALYWTVQYEDEKTIDEINILQASQKAMHKCVDAIIKNVKKEEGSGSGTGTQNIKNVKLLVDGNYFKPFPIFNNKIEYMDSVCVEGGDNKYCSIAAASILAKVARDKYIEDLCEEHPDLIEKYSLDSNKGYGSKKHLDGIKQYGITVWHRRSFGICKNYAL